MWNLVQVPLPGSQSWLIPPGSGWKGSIERCEMVGWRDGRKWNSYRALLEVESYPAKSFSLLLSFNPLDFKRKFSVWSSVNVNRSVMSNSFRIHGLQPARLLCPWDSPGKNTGVGSQSLPQGIFLTQGLNAGLLHCRWSLHHLSHQGSPQCGLVCL